MAERARTQIQKASPVMHDYWANRKTVFLPAVLFGYENVFTASGTADLHNSLGTGAALLEEVSTSGIPGFLTEAGDMVATLFRVPDDLDTKEPIHFRPVWTPVGGVITDGVQWIVTIEQFTIDAGDAITDPNDALQINSAEQPEDDTPHALQLGYNNTLQADNLLNCNYLGIRVEADVVDNGAFVHFMGLEIEYGRKKI